MEPKQANFDIAKTKGELGENIFREYLEKRGWIVYFPFTKNSPHYFDMLSTKNKEKVFACDVKTKARLNYAPVTGINVKAYNEYINFTSQTGVPFYLIFIDDKTGEVHSANLNKLGEGKLINNNKIIVWPLAEMQYLFTISSENIKLLSQYDQRNYKFNPKITLDI